MALVRFEDPRAVFLALPFEVRDGTAGYRTKLLELEDKYEVKIKHGDHSSNAVGILERAFALMQGCRIRVFDLTGFKPNVVFEFGLAKGASLHNLYSIRRKPMFGDADIPTMMNNIDIPTYRDTKELYRVLDRAMKQHFWPTDEAFTLAQLPWLADQIRDLTYPGCEVDKFELEKAIGIDNSFITQAINQYFVASGDARPITMGPAPIYRFDYSSIRPVPPSAARDG